jgi:hypothetical protein
MDEVQFNRDWMAVLDRQVDRAQNALDIVLRHRAEVAKLLMTPKLTINGITEDCNRIAKEMNERSIKKEILG